MMNAQIIDGIMELIAMTVGGVLVGWVTSTFFARKAATAEVSGHVMKKKLEVYEELYKRLEGLTEQEIMPAPVREQALNMLRKNEFEVKPVPQNPVMAIFGSAARLRNAYLETDKFISARRIYFSDELFERMLLFTNYFSIFSRLLVLYEEQFINIGVPLSEKPVKETEDSLSLQIGLLYQDEFADEIKEVLYILRREIGNLELHSSGKRDHSSDVLGDEGRILKILKTRKIFIERDKIQTLITANIAIGMLSTQNIRL